MVRVLVRCAVVVEVEQTVIQVLVIVTTYIDARVAGVEVPVIARTQLCTDSPDHTK